MEKLKVVVLDMQPITPAVGGGRQRLLGLYHDLGADIETVYVGSYDWPGEKHKDQMLTDSLREICVPLSEMHYRAARETADRMAGRSMIDLEFPLQVELSPDYLATARREMLRADVVVFSHPWCYPPLAGDLQAHHLVVYDSQNVESVLRVSLHDDLPQSNQLLELVADSEASLLARSDLVYCCSGEEVELFSSIYEVQREKLRIAPNGTFIKYSKDGLISARDGVAQNVFGRGRQKRMCVVFMGSQYGPNAEAGRFIVEELAPQIPQAIFLLIGGVGEYLQSYALPQNIVCAGVVDERKKWELLLSADMAINPMFSGAGTNVKMFDFLAAGLPVLTTRVGARGITDENTVKGEIIIETRGSFGSTLKQLLDEPISVERRLASLAFVEKRFSWEVISRVLGAELRYYATHRERNKSPLLMFSTWGTACGIAEHTQYLADALRDAGANVVMFGNLLTGHEPTGVASDLRFPVIRGWRWDNKLWRESYVDLTAFESALDMVRPIIVVLQHHTGFLSVGEYSKMVVAAKRRSIPVIIECHDAAHLEQGQVALLAEAGAEIFVHSRREAENLKISNIIVRPLPVRVLTSSDAKLSRSRTNADPVIGGFGFFREYKGIDVALESIKLLRKEFPGLRYKGWHAIYPGEEKSPFVQRCLSLIEQEGLRQAVTIDTSFIDIEKIITGLSQCDMVILPYADSSEGASAAANVALAAGVPLVISSSKIFSMLQHVAKVVKSRNGRSFADAITELLRDENEWLELAEEAKRWAESNSYLSMAQQILDLAS